MKIEQDNRDYFAGCTDGAGTFGELMPYRVEQLTRDQIGTLARRRSDESLAAVVERIAGGRRALALAANPTPAADRQYQLAPALLIAAAVVLMIAGLA